MCDDKCMSLTIVATSDLFIMSLMCFTCRRIDILMKPIEWVMNSIATLILFRLSLSLSISMSNVPSLPTHTHTHILSLTHTPIHELVLSAATVYVFCVGNPKNLCLRTTNYVPKPGLLSPLLGQNLNF